MNRQSDIRRFGSEKESWKLFATIVTLFLALCISHADDLSWLWRSNTTIVSLNKARASSNQLSQVVGFDNLAQDEELLSHSPTAGWLLTESAIIGGKSELAINLLAKLPLSSELDLHRATRIGILLWSHDQKENALVLWQKLVRMSPLVPVILANAIQKETDLFSLPANDESADLLDEIGGLTLAHWQLPAEAYAQIGRVYARELKDSQRAREWLDQAEYHYPNSAEILTLLFETAVQQEDYESALGYLDRLMTNPERNVWYRESELHLQRSELLLRDPFRLMEAIYELEQVVSLTPDYAYAHFSLAQAYLRAGERGKARHEFEVVLTFPQAHGIDYVLVHEQLEALTN